MLGCWENDLKDSVILDKYYLKQKNKCFDKIIIGENQL